MGFDPETKDGHRVYWPEKRSVSVERSVRFKFNEEMVIRVLPIEGEKDTTEEPRAEDQGTVEDPEPEEAEGRGKRIRKESEYVRMLKQGSATTGPRSKLPKGMQSGSILKSVEQEVAAEHAMASVIENMEGSMPTYEEALKRPDWPKWSEAIDKELDGLKGSGTFELVKRPSDTNIVGSKWVLKIKKDSAGEILKYKARLVAKGFTQIYGVDYYETYAPVARLASFRILLALAA